MYLRGHIDDNFKRKKIVPKPGFEPQISTKPDMVNNVISQVIGARKWMMIYDDDDDGQMIFGDLWVLKPHDICLTGEEKPRKNLTQETCPERGSNLGPLRDRCACYHLAHSGGR